MSLKIEVLPAPLGPITANNSPGCTWNDTSVSALTPAKRTEMSSTESNGDTAFGWLTVLTVEDTSLISPTSSQADVDGACSYYYVLLLHAVLNKTCVHSHLARVPQQAVLARLYRSPAHTHGGQLRVPFARSAQPRARQ